MFTNESEKDARQKDLFKVLLIDLVRKDHELIRLADSLDWEAISAKLAGSFSEGIGRPSCSARLMVGLVILKYSFDLSDQAVLDRWLENPYWQYFTGGTFFEHDYPTDQASMSRWRRKIEKSGAEEILRQSINVGLNQGVIKKSNLERVNEDTTVQEKNVRFPTDTRLYDRAREQLVKQATKEGIVLRQNYERISKKELRKQSGYMKANQFKRAQKSARKIKIYLGRVVRDIRRKRGNLSKEMQEILVKADRLLAQSKASKNKILSIHEPQVECISKGKAHKKYEFGVKVGYVSTSRGNWIVGAQTYPHNPYDGHTLKPALEQTTRILGIEPKMAICDLGYRGHNYEGKCDVQVVNRYRKTVSRSMRKWWDRRSAIEPIIGHLKSDNRLSRNYLKGVLGDELNCIFAAIGYNIRKLLRAFRLFLSFVYAVCFLLFSCRKIVNRFFNILTNLFLAQKSTSA